MNFKKIRSVRSSAKKYFPGRDYCFGFRDQSMGYGFEVRGGRVFEKIARSKIFWQKYI